MGTATRAMAVGKNKRLTKGKKGSKKKAIDPFTKKDWYDVKAPALFTNTNVGKTLVTRTAGTKIASDGLKGRVFEVSLGDLNKSEDDSFRKIRLRVEDVQGTQCLTNFWGMSFTTDKLRSLVRKWQSLIEAHCDVKTTDNYLLRVFCIGFTDVWCVTRVYTQTTVSRSGKLGAAGTGCTAQERSGAPGDPVCEARLFLREISFLARRLDYTKGRQGGGSAAASRAKSSQQMLCRRVECAVVAHQVTLPPKERLPTRCPPFASSKDVEEEVDDPC